jgi:hypothetical protein
MQNNNMNYILYGTSACHLCEQAEAIISALPSPLNVQKIDIAEDEQLSEKYGIKIPVLKSMHTQRELHWPFTSEALLSFINAE